MSEKPSWTKWVPEAVASTARARVFMSSRIPQRRSAMTISITRVYTRLGDKGETALVGGKRVPKDSPRIVAYGTIDELNAIVGIVRTFNEERLGEGEHHRWLDEVLRRIQNELFDLGSELATPPEAEYEGMFKVGEAQVTALERLMDHCRRTSSRSSRSRCRAAAASTRRSEEHTSELQSHSDLVCRLLLEKKKKINKCIETSSLITCLP